MDYYPFGMQLPYRNGAVNEAYRRGFNGMEKDDELKGAGNSYDFGARMYDPRVGRWLSRDPLESKYADFSLYTFSLNNPIYFVDPTGKSAQAYYANGVLTIKADIILYTGDKSVFDGINKTAIESYINNEVSSIYNLATDESGKYFTTITYTDNQGNTATETVEVQFDVNVDVVYDEVFNTDISTAADYEKYKDAIINKSDLVDESNISGDAQKNFLRIEKSNKKKSNFNIVGGNIGSLIFGQSIKDKNKVTKSVLHEIFIHGIGNVDSNHGLLPGGVDNRPGPSKSGVEPLIKGKNEVADREKRKLTTYDMDQIFKDILVIPAMNANGEFNFALGNNPGIQNTEFFNKDASQSSNVDSNGNVVHTQH